MWAARRQIVARALLPQQIVSLFRRRISQEREGLRASLRAVFQNIQGILDPNAQVIRRLARREWPDLKASGRLAIPGAAVNVVVLLVHKNMLKPGPKPNRPPPASDDCKDDDRGLNTFCEDVRREIPSRRKIPIYHGAAI